MRALSRQRRALIDISQEVALALPCVTVIQFHAGEITDYRVHMDITPALA
ncbi:hypothetical protein ACFVWG_12975 [Kribbella sp. NPDC058245]